MHNLQAVSDSLPFRHVAVRKVSLACLANTSAALKFAFQYGKMNSRTANHFAAFKAVFWIATLEFLLDCPYVPLCIRWVEPRPVCSRWRQGLLLNALHAIFPGSGRS